MPHFAWRYPEKGLTLETEAEVEQCVKQHTVKPAPDNATGQYLDFKDMEEKQNWLEAFREALRLYYLESDQAVLKRVVQRWTKAPCLFQTELTRALPLFSPNPDKLPSTILTWLKVSQAGVASPIKGSRW